MASFPKGSVEEDIKKREDIVNPIKIGGSTKAKVKALAKLSKDNEPRLRSIVHGLLDGYQVNLKKPERIESKSSRHTIKKDDAWFDVEHLRDALRFRSRPTTVNDFAEALERLRDSGLAVVKVDLAKFMKPKMWGWRFAGADFRMPDRQLVEYYAAFAEMMEANDGECHRLYEKWRDATELSDDAELDVARSKSIFQAAWRKALDARGLTEEDVQAQWEAVRERLGR